ncbi:MAG: hypothetical protein ACYDC3_02000 [Candidatus Binataceae bacterium]
MALIAQIFAVGFATWYGGGFLRQNPGAYGRADSAGAWLEVIQFILSSFTLAVLCVLLERRAEATAKLALPNGDSGLPLGMLAGAWLIAFPFFALQRGNMASGSIVYLAAEASQPRCSGRRVIAGALVGFAFVFGVAIIKLRNPDVSGAETMTAAALVSELSAWVAYKEIKRDIGELHYQYGYRIIVPLVLKFVPRGVYPDKPYNSGGYVAKHEHSAAAAAGLISAETYLGDLYLNFGIFGVLVGTALIGMFSGSTDAIVLYGRRDRLGRFLLILFYYFSLLRNNFSESIFMMGIALMLYMFARRIRIGHGKLAIGREVRWAA